LKILILANCPPYDYTGSGLVIKNFTEGLKKEGHDVDFFDERDYILFPKFFKGRAIIYRQAIGKFFFIIKKLFEKKYDMIEFWGADSWLSVLYCRLFYKKIFLVHHTNGIETQFALFAREHKLVPKKWYHLNLIELYDVAFSKVHGIVSVSEEDVVWAKKRYKNLVGIKSIQPSLDNRFIGLQNSDERKKIIGYSGSWQLRKGIKLIESDIPRILREYPDAIFRMIGAEENFRKEDHFPEDVLSQIEVIGYVTDKNELIRHYQEIAIHIVPSFSESFGYVIAEAMACGCAMVAYPTGYAYLLKHNDDALLIKDHQPDSLYMEVKKLLDDDSLRIHIAHNGYKKVQDLTWEKSQQTLSQTYNNWCTEFIKKSYKPSANSF
jgi:glycosyltransferase involved in cell wall biosynthesis